MGQNWNEMNGAKMMNEIFAFIVANNMTIIFCKSSGDDPDDVHDGGHQQPEDGMTESHLPHPDKYPWIATVAPPSCACGSGGCGCPRRFVPWRALHLYTWDHFKGATRPRKSQEVVHHKNHDKHDARIKNLGVGTRSAHARAHNLRRQKFAPKKRQDLRGFYRPQHQPGPVTSRPEMIGSVGAPAIDRPLSTRDRIKMMVGMMGIRWEQLSAELAHLDSGNPIARGAPRAAWKAPKTRKMGIRMPRLDLWAGEAVFVLLLVKHRFDMDAVAADAGEPRELLQTLWKVPAVSVAVSRWRNQRRLPLFK